MIAHRRAVEVKPNLLPEDYIQNGNVIWYSGSTSMSGWDCPAEIIDVNEMNRTFRVRSLDDCKEQRQVYTFAVGEFSPESRCSMFVPSEVEIDIWLRGVVGVMRSLRITEALPDRFIVHFESRYGAVAQWLFERWAAKQGIVAVFGLDKEMQTQFSFRSMEDAALCHLTFSQGLNWSMIE